MKLAFFESEVINKKRSISRTLTVLLTATVVMVSISTVSVIYLLSSKKGITQLSEKADEIMGALYQVLEMPLWNMDHETIVKIGEAYAQNDLLEELTIADVSGSVYYELKRISDSPLVTRTRKIRHDDLEIGYVTLALTTKFQIHQNRQTILTGAGLLLVVVIALVAVTHFFFNSLLKKLLSRLEMIADAYASGNNDSQTHLMPFYEFQALLRILGDMRDKLNAQFKEIKSAEKKYRSIFENAVEGIFQTTHDGRKISANPAMARMLGYESQEELDASITDVGKQLYLNPEHRENLIRQLTTGENVSGFQTRLRCKDGSFIRASIHARPVFDEDGGIIMIEGIVQDITGQKQAEETKRRLEKQLQQAQKMESLGTLAGGIAHDFNNILSPLVGFAELLESELPSDSPLRGYVEGIQKASLRARDMVKQILVFSRQEEKEIVPLKLQPILKEAIRLLRSSIPTTIEISQNICRECGIVMADPTQIHQIVMNLATNAYHAMEKTGGRLEITLEQIRMESGAISHGELPPGEYALLTVADTGIGIPDSIKDKIFDPYFTTKEKNKGTGLGLAVVQGIVKSFKGDIRLASEPGKGTVFSIYLPIEKQVAEKDREKSYQPIPGGNEKVLLVDDEESVVLIVAQMLTKLGYRVTACSGSIEAKEVFLADPESFDIVLTDMTMPAMTGVQLSQEVKRIRSGIPVVLSTGFSDQIGGEKFEALDMQGLIMKPVMLRDLAETIRKALDSSLKKAEGSVADG